MKLVRYEKFDPYDIASILRLGKHKRGVQWTQETLEGWLVGMCSAMGYERYPRTQMEVTRQKMRHAIGLALAQG